MQNKPVTAREMLTSKSIEDDVEEAIRLPKDAYNSQETLVVTSAADSPDVTTTLLGQADLTSLHF